MGKRTTRRQIRSSRRMITRENAAYHAPGSAKKHRASCAIAGELASTIAGKMGAEARTLDDERLHASPGRDGEAGAQWAGEAIR